MRRKLMTTSRLLLRGTVGMIATVWLTCGFAFAQYPIFQPSTEYSTLMGGAPSMAAFGGYVWIGFRSNDSSNSLWIKQSNTEEPASWPYAAVNYPNYKMAAGHDPKLGANDQFLFVTFADPTNPGTPDVLWSSDGSTWNAINLGPGATGADCGFANFNSSELLLCPAFIGSPEPQEVLWVFTFQPNAPPQDSWVLTAAPTLPNIQAVGAPSAAQLPAGDLYVALEQSNQSLAVLQSSDGVNFTTTTYSTTMGSPPTMTVYDARLQIAFQSQEGSPKPLFVKTSEETGIFDEPAHQYSIDVGGSPALAVNNNYIYLGFESATSDNLFTSWADTIN